MERRGIKRKLTYFLLDEFCEDTTRIISLTNMVALSLKTMINVSNITLWIPTFMDDTHYRNPLFYEEWIHRYLDFDYFQCFRMKRETLEELLKNISRIKREPRRLGRGIAVPITTDKALHICLWYLGKGDSIHSIADRFNTSLQGAHIAISSILKALESLKSKFIKWPSEEQFIDIEKNFRKISGFPGVNGLIDGCHFKLKVRTEQQDSYQDRYMQHSITMQGIGLPNYILSNISVGYPGSLHDARILRESNIFQYVEQYGSQDLFHGKYHLLGDSAYPCKIWLLTPYKNFGNLSRAQMKYNKCLSKTRVKIENIFGLLKTRWRILNYINVYSIERAVSIINSSCILHNFCILNNDQFAFNEVADLEEENIIFGNEENDGEFKRDIICGIINGEL